MESELRFIIDLDISTMDGDGGLNMRNWGYYESPLLKNHLGMQIMPSVADRKPIIGGRDASLMENVNGGFNQRDCGVSSSQFQMNNYMRDAWVHREAKFFDMLPNNPNYPHMPETSAAHFLPVQMIQQPESSTDDRVVHMDERVSESSNSPARKRSVGKAENAPKTKKSKKGPNAKKDGNSASSYRAKSAKKVTEVIINGITMDISSIPIPVCSCTTTPQQCYRWGSGGWQSACCTTGMSHYPLPMNTKRRGARIAGRKMSLGAFKKVLERLAAEGYNFSNPIDLKTHWAKHGTNKFVTIR